MNMVVPLLFFFAALSAKQDQTALRSGCDATAELIASLPAGTPVDIRFRLADGSDCFKVSTILDGKLVMGYVPASVLAGLEEFEQGRTSAASADTLRELRPMEAASQKLIVHSGDLSLERAAQLLASNQPAQALELLEPALKRHRNDANVLLLTGLAAYRADQLRAAIDYWKQSLDLAPNETLARVYERVRREAASDNSGEKLLGMHIALRYEGEALPTDTARVILSTLDEEYNRISSQLGCSSQERTVAIVQSREAYLRGTGAAEWSGGQYDGRIHIAWTEGKEVGPQMRRALAHELVHACLTSMPSGGTPWPAWLQEGLAQKLSGDQLSPIARGQLRQLAAAHQIPRLEDLHQDWSQLSIDNARLAYNLALAAADALYDNYSSFGIRNVINNPQKLPQITADLDKKLGL
jgi:tetratricopeptide (TPR) repeat protein